MKNKKDISELLSMSYKDIERELDIKIRNGQTVEGIRKALYWVIGGYENEEENQIYWRHILGKLNSKKSIFREGQNLFTEDSP